jgi:sulfur-oxidizing protein SoxX
MNITRIAQWSLLAGSTALLLSGCASQGGADAANVTFPNHTSPASMKKATMVFKRDFQARGIAGVDRLTTDKLQDVCNRSGNNPSADIAAVIEFEETERIKMPAGSLLGDWKAGEKLAQSGTGLTWSDGKERPIGGNCYNCHQLSKSEIAYGTIGPSLLNFGKLRGNSEEIQKYTYAKIYNAKAFNVCSAMPRFGHVGALNEKQIKDLVALLLDPESPVNK